MALLLEAATEERVLRPSSIELLMHCYYMPNPHPEASEACMQSAMGQLREYGLVNDKGEVTDRGTAHCKAMMYLSLPEQIWVDADREATGEAAMNLSIEAATHAIAVANAEGFEVGQLITVNAEHFKVIGVTETTLEIRRSTLWERAKGWLRGRTWNLSQQIQSLYYRVEDWVLAIAENLLEKK